MKVDCIAKITNLRDKPFRSGFRPAHFIREDYLTTGQYIFDDEVIVGSGDTVIGKVMFISPEVYPHTLYQGRVIDGYEGRTRITSIEIVEVLNPILDVHTDEEIHETLSNELMHRETHTVSRINNNLRPGSEMHPSAWNLLNDMYPNLLSSYILQITEEQMSENITILVDYGDVVIFCVDYAKNSVIDIKIVELRSYIDGLDEQEKTEVYVALEAVIKDLGI